MPHWLYHSLIPSTPALCRLKTAPGWRVRCADLCPFIRQHTRRRRARDHLPDLKPCVSGRTFASPPTRPLLSRALCFATHIPLPLRAPVHSSWVAVPYTRVRLLLRTRPGAPVPPWALKYQTSATTLTSRQRRVDDKRWRTNVPTTSASANGDAIKCLPTDWRPVFYILYLPYSGSTLRLPYNNHLLP